MWPKIKKYGKYILIILAAAGLVALWITIRRWFPKKDQTGEAINGLRDVLQETGAQMIEANQQATVEIAAARDKENKVKGKLTEVVAIKDKGERRQGLADLYKEVSDG